MQNFKFEVSYNLILMRYCAGYLNDKQLIKFLTKARNNLKGHLEQVNMNSERHSYIVLVDNVCEEGEDFPIEDG